MIFSSFFIRTIISVCSFVVTPSITGGESDLFDAYAVYQKILTYETYNFSLQITHLKFCTVKIKKSRKGVVWLRTRVSPSHVSQWSNS